MVKIELETSTLAVLIAGMYCAYNEVNSIAIPESIWLGVAEKLEFFVPNWDYEKLSFEDWVKNCLLIYPKVLVDEEDIEYYKENSLYWEVPNGNMILMISMNISDING